MSRFITDIAEQTITIEGRTYTADDATASDELPSALQTAMREQYGKDSFMADLSDFLSEWFNGLPYTLQALPAHPKKCR